MKRIQLAVSVVAAFAFLLAVAAPAQAVDAAAKCQASLLKASSKLASCRLNADSKAAKKGVTPDYSKCAPKFRSSWDKATDKGRDACPNYRPTDDGDFYVAAIEDATNRVAETLDPTSPNSGNLPYCKLPASGQVTSYEPGDDGSYAAGSKLPFTRSGYPRSSSIPDYWQAIVDQRTGLMWEVKDDAGGVRDVDNLYCWDPDPLTCILDNISIWDHVDDLNDTCRGDGAVSCSSHDDCGSGGNDYCGYAGFRDWRVPNIKELLSIVNYEIPVPGPVVDPVFHSDPSGCTTGCTNCSCTASMHYWSATTSPFFFPLERWFVDFHEGDVNDAFDDPFVHKYGVRAVRAGL